MRKDEGDQGTGYATRGRTNEIKVKGVKSVHYAFSPVAMYFGKPARHFAAARTAPDHPGASIFGTRAFF
jgi:hypothetical protein